jgi:hypothetical protein
MRLMPFARNPRKEVSKMPKVFFADCGWRNLVSACFVEWEGRPDRGEWLETAVEHWLREHFPLADVRFWRSQAKAETGPAPDKDLEAEPGACWRKPVS